MSELDFITDMVEEKLVKGNLRWLANFNEIHRDYDIGDITFPIYASGSLQEKGFLLSRIFSALVTPKYKIHFFLYTSSEVDPKFLRKMILAWKNKFGEGDWVFLDLVQSQSFGKTTKEAVESITDKNIGIAAYSLTSKETVASNNVLGRGLTKQLKLTEAKFEAFDLPNYLKSFVMILVLGILFLIFLHFSGLQQALSLFTLALMTIFSLIGGYPVYKTRYHTTLSLNNKGFQLQKGKKITDGKWSNYTDATICITPNYESYIRLHSTRETFDLPLSRVGLSRRDAYNAIRQLIKKK
jgi:hypothetical protein